MLPQAILVLDGLAARTFYPVAAFDCINSWVEGRVALVLLQGGISFECSTAGADNLAFGGGCGGDWWAGRWLLMMAWRVANVLHKGLRVLKGLAATARDSVSSD
jgi:hypothetical protein